MKAQLALGRYGHLELRSNGGIEAGAGCRSVLESGEMEPSQVVVEVFGGHTASDAQEGLDPLMQAVDGLDVQFAAYPLARRLVQYLVGDLHPGGTARQSRAAIGNQQGVFAEDGFEHDLNGVRAVHWQDGADDCAASVGRHQDRHLLVRQAPLRGLAAAPAGLAIRRLGSGPALFRALPGPGALIAEQHEGFAALPFGSSASTMPVRIGLAAGAVRKRWRQRKAVLSATPHRSAEATTVSPSLSDRPKSSQHSFFRNRANGVPVSALKLLPHPLHRNRRSPSAWPQPTDAPWPQCGQRRSSPGLVSITAVTAARGGRPASTSSSSGRCSTVKSSPSASHARKTPCSITNSLNTRRILPWVAVPT